MTLKDKTVLITGGSSGMGKAMALAFAKAGSNIVFTYNTKKTEAAKVESQIKKMGVDALAMEVDLQSEPDIENLFKQVANEFKKLDILINNAGINRPRELFAMSTWRETFQVNLFAAVFCSEKAIELMKNGGKIINISSIYAEGKACFKGLAAYGASKAALSHFTQTLAKNLAPNTLVNAIAPGYVQTPLWEDTSEADFIASGKEQLIDRMIMPEEIASMAVVIAENDAMTGEVVVVDGGISLKTI